MTPTLTRPDDKIRKAVVAEMNAQGLSSNDVAVRAGVLETSVLRFLGGKGINSNTLASILAALDLEVV